MSGDHRLAEKAAGELRAAVKQLFDRNVTAKAPVIGLENPTECASSHLARDCVDAGGYDGGLGLAGVGRELRRLVGINACWLFGILRGSKLDRRREPHRSCLRPRMSFIRLVVPAFPVPISAPTHETPAIALSPRNENKSLALLAPFLLAIYPQGRLKSMNNTKKSVEKIGARKLVLNRETLRTIASGELSGIGGGVFGSIACTIVTTPASLDADCYSGTLATC